MNDKKVIGINISKNCLIVVMRDQHGKFYIYRNDKLIKNKLNAEETVKYLLNSARNFK